MATEATRWHREIKVATENHGGTEKQGASTWETSNTVSGGITEISLSHWRALSSKRT